MISLSSWGMTVFLKIYVAIVLIIAVVLSPLPLSFVPILLLVWHLYLWRWPVTAVVNLQTTYFLFFAVALLFSPHVGPFFSLLVSLPVLFLVNHSLQKVAGLIDFKSTRYIRRPTEIYLTLLIVVIIILGISLLIGSLSLLLACVVIIIYLTILGVIVLRELSLKPVLRAEC